MFIKMIRIVLSTKSLNFQEYSRDSEEEGRKTGVTGSLEPLKHDTCKTHPLTQSPQLCVSVTGPSCPAMQRAPDSDFPTEYHHVHVLHRSMHTSRVGHKLTDGQRRRPTNEHIIYRPVSYVEWGRGEKMVMQKCI